MVFPSSKRYININCGPCKASEPVNRSKQQFDRLEEIIADFANKHEASLNEAAILKGENGKIQDENKKLQNENQKLQDENGKLRDEAEKLRSNIEDLITCQICLERFQSAGERLPCKLKCPHIMCKKCAEDWLKKVI